MKKLLQRLYAVSGTISLTKIGGSIAAAASAVVTLAMTHLVEIPYDVTIGAVVIAFLGGKLTIDGARDAIAKIKVPLPSVMNFVTSNPNLIGTAINPASIASPAPTSGQEKTVPVQNPPFEAGV